MVLLHHYRLQLPTPDILTGAYKLMQFWSGVDVFFAISGFVITRSLMDRGDVARGGFLSTAAVRGFWWRRAKRLLPASLFWLLMVMMVSALITSQPIGSFLDLLPNYLSAMTGTANVYIHHCIVSAAPQGICATQMTGIYWSLATEEQFYLVVALLLFVFRAELAVKLIIGLAVLHALLGLVLGIQHFSILWITRCQGLAIGVAVAFYLPEVGKLKVVKLSRSHRVSLIVATLVAIALLSKMSELWFTLPVIGLLSGCLIVLATPDHAISRGPAGRALVWLGYRSFSLYLCHQVVFHLIREIGYRVQGEAFIREAGSLETLLYFGCGIGLSIVMADWSFRFIENRFAGLRASAPTAA